MLVRKQFVPIIGTESETSNATCGVPQGSLLVEHLSSFLIYINNFRFSLFRQQFKDQFAIPNCMLLKSSVDNYKYPYCKLLYLGSFQNQPLPSLLNFLEENIW